MGWILVTGFGPFPGVDVNPTQTLAEEVAQRGVKGVEVVCAVLDVSFDRSAEQVRELVTANAEPPAAMIHFGVAGGADRIRIEQQAVNRKAASIPDVDGHRFEADVISSAHALDDVLLTTVDVEALTESLNRAGLDARVSDDAGRYVCNSTYFHSLALRPETVVLFVHVPPIGSDPDPDASRSTVWTSARLLAAAEHVLGWIVSTTGQETGAA